MADESQQDSAPFDVFASPFSQPTAPSWVTEAVIVLRAFWSRWALIGLATGVPVPRGRAGTYVVLDVVLVLVTYAVSGATHLKSLYEQAGVVEKVLSAVWLRERWLSRSALSRFLADFSPTSVEALRTFFYRSADPWCGC